MSFKFIDLFAGIGGFHGALSALGGECVYASEIDRKAARIYLRNWGIEPDGDITLVANDSVMEIPEHDVLVGGFPCQPFSKSGKQLGMEETRGTLFWNIAKIIEARKPKLVLLENVRNIAGPRHKHEWDVIIQTLRDLGYRVSEKPFVVTPHKINPVFGGRPQVRDRVFIAATLLPKGLHLSEELMSELPNLQNIQHDWNPKKWKLERDLPVSVAKGAEAKKLKLSGEEAEWVAVWDQFVQVVRANNDGQGLPGFPVWVDSWIERKKLKIPAGTPKWKINFLEKNSDFYTANKKVLDKWLKMNNNLEHFPASRRKFEWQAQDSKSLYDTIMHFRPSGIRAKKANYVPALVAITQTSILGKKGRRLSVREGARLQGFPEWFDFLDQTQGQSFKQLGNAVNIGAVYNVLRAQVIRDLELLKSYPKLTKSILSAPNSPDEQLSTFKEPNLPIEVIQRPKLKLVENL